MPPVLDYFYCTIKVYTFEIEWFDGSIWRNLGSVQDYIMQAPFYTVSAVQVTQQNAQTETAAEGGEAEESQDEEESGDLLVVFHLC